MSAVLRAKFSVSSIAAYSDQNGDKTSEVIELAAVYGGAEGTANKDWSKWTPQGNIKMTISNPAAFDRLRTGQFVFVDFIPCGKND